MIKIKCEAIKFGKVVDDCIITVNTSNELEAHEVASKYASMYFANLDVYEMSLYRI